MAELPIAPDEIILTSVGRANRDQYLAAGLADWRHINDFLRASGLDISKGKYKILDWGCGSGRVARHWEPLKKNVELFGCDIIETAARWCQENLTFGTFSVSTHSPPLKFPDGYFDAIYGISVLTHLSFEAHYLWMRELWRLLKPNGVAVLTTHGPSMLPTFLRSLANKAAEKIVCNLIDEVPFLYMHRGQGVNQTGNVVEFRAFSKIFYPFEILDYKPRHGLMGFQNSYLLKKNGDCQLTVIDDFLEVDMTGQSFQHDVSLDWNGGKSLCVLAQVPNLVKPARIQLRMRHLDRDTPVVTSNTADLPSKAHWARLDAAYSSLVIENIPAMRGLITATIDVKGSGGLNGLQLVLKHAIIS